MLCRNVCDITYPFFICVFSCKLSIEKMRSDWMSLVSFCSQYPTSFAASTERCLPHQPGDPFARATAPLITQFPVQTWTPISPFMLLKCLSKLLRKESIFSVARADRPLAPGILAAFGHGEH